MGSSHAKFQKLNKTIINGEINELEERLIKEPNLVNDQFGSLNLTLLHVASQYNNIKVVELILNHGSLINPLDFKNKTPLHYACMKCACNNEVKRESHLKVAELLILCGANHLALTTDGKLPFSYLTDFFTELNVLHMALSERIKIVQKISEEEFWLESNKQKDNAMEEKKEKKGLTNISIDDYNLNDLMNISFDMNMFFGATNEKSNKYFNDLYTQDMDDVLFKISSSIIFVGIGTQTDINNFNYNNNLKTKIPLSTSQIAVDTINDLLSNEESNNNNYFEDVDNNNNDNNNNNNNNKDKEPFLQLAPEIIDLAYSIYANRNEKLQKIFKLAEKGLYKELSWNLNKNPNFINMQMEPINFTLIHICCQYGNLKSIYMLLEKGCDVNVEDEFGFTPIMYALQQLTYYSNELDTYNNNDNNDNNDSNDNNDDEKQAKLYLSIIKLLINYNANLTLRNKKNIIQFQFKSDIDILLLEEQISSVLKNYLTANPIKINKK